MASEFTQFELHPQLIKALLELNYTTPTPIQSATIPVLLTGKDVIGQAKTGTGKTAAFSLPILQKLVSNQKSVQSLILTPTRELAMQVANSIYDYGRYNSVKVLAIFGGQSYRSQISRLRAGVNIVVGTPGRLLDLIQQKALNLNSIKTVILDEADEMLSMGFIEDIETIFNEIPAERQVGLFSATLPREVRNLATSYLKDPQHISIENKRLTVDTIEQRYYLVNERDKLAALTRLFEIEEITRAIVFTRTRANSTELANKLITRNFTAEALNGDLSQDARLRVLGRFQKNQLKVLVATDVAARGLDIDDISHVFNYDLPLDPEVYVHRIGRTGRIGKTGIAISLIPPKELYSLRRIESYAKQKVTQATLPTVEDIVNHREQELLKQVNVWLQRGRCKQEREMVLKLIEQGHQPIDIAAVALKLARAEEKQRPIAAIGKVESPHNKYKQSGEGRKRKRLSNRVSDFREEGMVQLSLSKGKVHGVRPNDVVGVIAYHAGIPGHTIGKIQIQKERTLVDVPEKLVSQVLAKTGSYKIHKQAITIEKV